MKKWLISGSVLAMVLAAGCGQRVTFEEAKTIALEDAGVAADEVLFTKEKQEKDEYEFEFQTEDSVFSYEISPGGKIESKERELRQSKIVPDSAGNGEAESSITAEEASGGVNAAGDSNGGPSQSEGSNGGTDAAASGDTSGSISDSTSDEAADSAAADGTQTPASSQGSDGDIGADKAKQIALEKAGFAENEVQRMKVEKDREDGVVIYEVEFKQGKTEYSYEIIAATGEIVKAETELDDH